MGETPFDNGKWEATIVKMRERWARYVFEHTLGRRPLREQISYKELSRRSGGRLSYRTILSWVQHRALPTAEEVAVLAEALGLPRDEMLAFAGILERDALAAVEQEQLVHAYTRRDRWPVDRLNLRPECPLDPGNVFFV